MTRAKAQKPGRERLARELPPLGTQLSGRYRGQEFSAEVVATETGEGAHAVECQGARYRSLSAAAKAITGNSVNGWRFWKVVEPQMPEEPEPATVE
jgi:hypothetical protein